MVAFQFPQLFRKKLNTDQIETQVLQAQQGDEAIRHELIENYQPFIKKVISNVCKKYIHDSMDEYSIGLLAFNEAIDQYKSVEGGRFLTFASVVIKRRIIDFIRKEYNRNKHIAVHLDQDQYDEENVEEHYVHQQSSIDFYEREQEQQSRVVEIQEFQQLLLQFGITFDVLSKKCPKHHDARENARVMAKLLAEDDDMSKELMDKKRLPVQKLESLVTCSRKTIERNRKYIIAIALIYIGEFSSLKSYIAPEKRSELE